MLTILHPEVVPLINDLSTGLLPLLFGDESRTKLVVKAPKEVLLAAKVNNGFKLYVIPLVLSDRETIGLISAFFDDEDEPLVIFTPLFKEEWIQNLLQALTSDALDIHLFDDHGRELLGYVSHLQCPSTTRNRLVDATLLSFDLALARSAHDQMARWFARRTPNDDLSAIVVTFVEALLADDILILDARADNHSYQGSAHFSFSQLVREEPGSFQERDIAQLLHKVFSPEQIYINPLRVTDREEITDVLVLTASRALLIQAKDSPNTEGVLRNPVGRKKATTQKALFKAIRQVRGAVQYLRSMSPVKMIIGDNSVEADIAGREIRALIVVKELFNDEYSVYSPPILALSEDTAVPCIALDYRELHMYATNLSGEESFFKAFDRVFSYGSKTGEFPRLRIW